MYVKPDVRHGLLKRMLTELLETRVMVKQAMKITKDNKVIEITQLGPEQFIQPPFQSLMKVLNARQLGLKYICNVTYGYTSATYSGRMPAVEIADSIVQTGRETLEKVRATRIPRYTTTNVIVRPSPSSTQLINGEPRSATFHLNDDSATDDL